jgi:hypothetical protein
VRLPLPFVLGQSHSCNSIVNHIIIIIIIIIITNININMNEAVPEV